MGMEFLSDESGGFRAGRDGSRGTLYPFLTIRIRFIGLYPIG
jgi:hypothetical protein